MRGLVHKKYWKLYARLSAVVILLGTVLVIQAVHAAANISGTVFADYNANGVQDNASGATQNRAADVGVGGVTVKAYDSAGLICDTETTAANGTYVLNMASCTGTQFRVEFSSLPSTYKPTQATATNGTTTQFVAPGGTANLGINKFGDYTQTNPSLATTWFHPGPYCRH
jgi:hypothetical protein